MSQFDIEITYFRSNCVCLGGCAIREQFDRKFFAFFHEIDYIHAGVVLSKGNGILRHEMRRSCYFLRFK